MVALVAAIQECLNTDSDKRAHMVKVGQGYAADKFGIDPVVSAMDKLYKGLFSDKLPV